MQPHHSRPTAEIRVSPPLFFSAAIHPQFGGILIFSADVGEDASMLVNRVHSQKKHKAAEQALLQAKLQ